MRLLFVHERFGAFAGAEANVLATARELKARGHAVGLLHGPSTGKGLASWLDTFPVAFPLAAPDGAARARAALAAFQPDVIYVHKLADLEILEALLAAGVPRVRMVHDHDLYCMRGCKYNYFTREICRRPASPFCVFPCGAFVVCDSEHWFPFRWVSYASKLREIQLNRKFHRLIVGSRFMKEELLRNQFAPDQIEIHPPLPPGTGAPPRRSLRDRNLILYVGQIIRGKGVDVLLESLARVREPFECLVFGDGNHRAHCERLSRQLGLAGRVHFQGHVSPEELQLHYRECRLLAVSSVWPEPFGAVGLEAMRFGVPIVAFDAGAIKEWLVDGRNGYLVPWMDRAAFAARVEELLRNQPLARQMGEQGRRLSLEQFDFGRYITGLEGVFARVAGQPVQTFANCA